MKKSSRFYGRVTLIYFDVVFTMDFRGFCVGLSRAGNNLLDDPANSLIRGT